MARTAQKKNIGSTLWIALAVTLALLGLSLVRWQGQRNAGSQPGFCCLKYGNQCQGGYTVDSCFGAGGLLFGQVPVFCHQACQQQAPQ